MNLTLSQQLAAALRLRRTVVSDGQKLTYLDGKPPLTDEQLAAAVPVPAIVELWRVRGVLTVQGKASAVDAAIAAMEDPQRTIVATAWNFGNTIRRDSLTVAALAGILHLSKSDVDALFIAADALSL